jgi:hypothetical protein
MVKPLLMVMQPFGKLENIELLYLKPKTSLAWVTI